MLTSNCFELSICSLNVRGLKKFIDDKEFINYCNKFDILSLCETWKTKSDHFSSFINEYAAFDYVQQNKKSSARGSGGISVLIHDKLMNTFLVKRIFHKFMECVVLYVDKYLFSGDKNIIMIFVYVSPEKSPFYESNRVNGIEDLSEKLTIISSDYPDAHLLHAGDFNARTKDIDDFIINDDIEHIFENVVDYPHDN